MKRRVRIWLIWILVGCLLGGCGSNAVVDTVDEASAETAGAIVKEVNDTSDSVIEEEKEIIDYTVRITEIMSSNKATLADKSGVFPDWIEIYNYGEQSIDLSMVRIKEGDGAEYIETIFGGEELFLEAGEYKVIFCSENELLSTDYWQAKLAISSDATTVSLISPDGIVIDSVELEAQESDYSAILNDVGTWESTGFATPGFSNDEEGYERYQATLVAADGLIISEVLVFNDSYAPLNYSYYDIVELKNNSDSSIHLADFYLTDKLKRWDEYRLPDVELEPGERYLIYCTGEESIAANNDNCTSFGLNAASETLYLLTDSGTITDYVHLHDIPRGSSFGRIDGENGFFYFDDPTPGTDNGHGYRKKNSMVTASVVSGVYEDVETLLVELQGQGTIYYTLNGSVPTESSDVYEKPFELTKTTVIRAMSISEENGISEVKTFSYVINEGHVLPVTSLVCDPVEMFGSSGVYTIVEDRERTCEGEVSFFANDGTGFTNGCTIGLHGANSRITLFKKSFKLTFGSTYGDVNYPLFEECGSDITSFRSLTLRGGGSDRLETLRDEAFCEVAENCSEEELYCLDSLYTVLYINGEYYGIYCWREAYSPQYIADHTGADEDDVNIVRSTLSRGTEFEQVSRFVLDNNMANPDNYAYAESVLDMRSLATWAAVEAFFENRDISGNIRYVKESPEGKWRIMLFDLDFTLVGQGATWTNVVNYNYTLGGMIGNLLSNPDFCEILLECTASLYHNGMDEEYVHSVLDKYIEQLNTEVERDCERWGVSVTSWYIYSNGLYAYSNHAHTIQWISNVQSLTRASDEKITELFGTLE